MKPTLILLGTSGCHLCDLAEDILYTVQSAQSFNLEIKDIIERDDWMSRYALKIPVVLDNSGRELCWPFDENRLLDFLAQ